MAPIERQQSNCCLSGKCGFDGGAPPPPQCEVGPAEEGQCLPSVFRRINFLKQNSSQFLSVHDVVGLPGCASVQQSTSEMKSSETFLPKFSRDGMFSGFGRAAAEG